MASTLQVDGVATFSSVPVFPNNTIETADDSSRCSSNADGNELIDGSRQLQFYDDLAKMPVLMVILLLMMLVVLQLCGNWAQMDSF